MTNVQNVQPICDSLMRLFHDSLHPVPRILFLQHKYQDHCGRPGAGYSLESLEAPTALMLNLLAPMRKHTAYEVCILLSL